MEINNKQLTLESRLFAKVLDYDIFIEELNMWAPILSYIPIKIKYILNMMNRHLLVEFKNKEDEERLYIFLKQYNILAKAENEKAKKEVYPIPTVAEDLLINRLKLTDERIKKESEKEKPNPFKVKVHTQFRQMPQSPNKRTVIVKRPKLYEAFNTMKTDSSESVSAEGSQLDLDLSD